MKGKILINAYLDSREYLYEAERLVEEFEKLGVDVSVVRLDEYPAIISDGKISIDFSADFFVYLDKDKYVLTMLEKSGAKVFNNARASSLSLPKNVQFFAPVASTTGIKNLSVLPLSLQSKTAFSICFSFVGITVTVFPSFVTLPPSCSMHESDAEISSLSAIFFITHFPRDKTLPIRYR